MVYICDLFCKIVDPKKIYLLYHPKNDKFIRNKDFINKQINLIDETKNDAISLFSKNTYLVNNGNGIGAAALAIGIKTLYIHHTVWQFWHTSHSNALCLPSKFFNSKKNENTKIENLINLAFSPKSIIPLEFQKDYYNNGIFLNRIQDIEEAILLETIREFINIEEIKRKKGYMLGCEFEYGSLKEKQFWESFIRNMPIKLRESHKIIKLIVSSSFLENL